jgi:5-formyltetrahydrofolate cyclo-ligase
MTHLPQVPIPHQQSAKSQLRKRMQARLKAAQPCSDLACAVLETWLAAHPTLRTIAVYSALSGEVDLSKIIRARPDLVWVYPRVVGLHLSFHSGLDFTCGAFGILEPAANSQEIPVCEIDVFLCPGLAFTVDGDRLGRGRGFYDRMLARARADAYKLGICFDFQLVPDTHSEVHDIQMNEVIF